ncbi:MAG: PAC2 family protein [Chloroflexota bacterium]|nr:PAC2 family protein [Chloroflexota bacterium]
MNELIDLFEKPLAEEIYMLAGWRQWADAGSISSGLPPYLVERTRARKIGELKSDSFYLFQVPGTHHLLRPTIKLEDGYRKELRHHKNELFYTGDQQRGLVILTGVEPHLQIDQYAGAFFAAAKQLGVRRIVAVGGVYGAMPYDKERQVSCVYSLPRMKEELTKYAVHFSNYEGGVSIGSYLADRAEREGMEYCTFYSFVPAYDFSHLSRQQVQGIGIEHDFKAWYELMRRLNHMFNLSIDLSELDRHSEELIASMDAKIAELERTMPQLKVKAYLDKLAQDFTEHPFMPLDDMWGDELEDIFRKIG